MKNLYKYIIAVATVLLPASCEEETDIVTEPEIDRRYELSFEPLTRTEISGTGTNRSVSWNDGDVIRYYTESNQSNPAEATVSVSGDKAYVTVPRGRKDEFINAVYGATQLRSGNSTDNCMYVSSPVKSSQRYTSFAEAHVCAAFSDDLEEPSLHFRNAACIVHFTSAAAVNKVVFYGNAGEIINAGTSGDLKITCGSGGALSVESAATGGSGQTSVTIATDGEESDFYFAILPVSFSEGIAVDCYDADGDLFITKRTSSVLNTVTDGGSMKILELGKAEDWVASAPPMAVDLGLSVKWASYNVGASKPEEYGDYFSWGETAAKSEYRWANYSYGQSKNGPFSKYVPDAAYGTVDHKLVLDLEDDAAYAAWGGDWRMPTREEFAELMTCSWVWTAKNGVDGYKVTGKNGNAIFLPANGMRSGSGISDEGTAGNYWSSSISADFTYFAVSPFFSQSEKGSDDCYRYFGLGIRAVNAAVVPVSEIALPEELILTKGHTESATLVATILPENATYKNLTWESSDDSVATVDKFGNVTAVDLGSASITVYSADGSCSARCEVAVNQPIQSVTLDTSSVEICVGDDPLQLIAEVLPEEHTDKILDWTSSKTSVATVDEEGRVTGVSAGTATITGTARDGSGKKASCTVKVFASHVESISLSKTELTIYKGKSYTLSATVTPSTASKSVSWTSSDEGVATVNQSGQVTAVSIGDVEITATTIDGSLSATCAVTVNQYVESITLDQTSVEMYAGDDPILLIATVLPDEYTDKTLEWTSSNSGVAKVDSEGHVTAVSAGTAIITAAAQDGSGVQATCAVSVSPAIPTPIDLGLSVKWSSWNLGASAPEEYGGYYAWGEVEPYYSSQDPLTWKDGKTAGYEWESYRWCNGSKISLTKYNTNSSLGTVDNKTVLDPGDDAAHVILGGDWRMPTDAEWTELRNNCTWTWTTINGVYGRKVTSNKSGYTDKWIFLPAAGLRRGTNLNNAGSYGYYWSSSLNSDRPYYAWFVYFNSVDVYRDYDFYRFYGQSVRPVTE